MQSGHVRCWSSQGSTHSLWNSCAHEMILRSFEGGEKKHLKACPSHHRHIMHMTTPVNLSEMINYFEKKNCVFTVLSNFSWVAFHISHSVTGKVRLLHFYMSISIFISLLFFFFSSFFISSLTCPSRNSSRQMAHIGPELELLFDPRPPRGWWDPPEQPWEL